MAFFQKLTEYFRDSILDTERLSPDIKGLTEAVKQPAYANVTKQKPFSVPADVWLSGQMSSKVTANIFDALEVKASIQEVSVIFIPRVDLRALSNTAFIGSGSPLIVPLVLAVSLTREGRLKPTQNTPYVPREWLAPNEKDEGAFASVTMLDAFLTLNPFNASSWDELLDYSQRLMLSLVSDDPQATVTDDTETLWDIPLLDDYQTRNDISLILLEPKVFASVHIRKIYDAIIQGCQPSRLFMNLFSIQPIAVETYEDLTASLECAHSHVGQMTGEFPLAKKQRNALHHVERMQDGDILTVNGPPGTGKTTLLRSVIANAWVNAAYQKAEPPITYVSSSNNQAVTNVLDSFFTINEDGMETPLKGRWLPVINTYGLKGVGSNADTAYPYMKKDGSGLMETMEQIPINELSAFFESSFYRWAPRKTSLSLEQMIAYLHYSLAKNIALQHTLPLLLTEFMASKKALLKDFSSITKLEVYLVDLHEKDKALEEEIAAFNRLNKAFLQCWQTRSIWSWLFSFLPFVKQRWLIANELLAYDNNLTVTGDYSDENIRAKITKEKRLVSQSKGAITQTLNALMRIRNAFQTRHDQLVSALDSALIECDVDTLTQAQLSDFLDISLRYKAFKLASHYWEGCWLKEMIDTPPEPAKTQQGRLTQYRRYAKLTPCFVSTFFMLPSFMEISRKEGDNWFSDVIVNGIDLLIIDEAGQALPHIAGASFAVAKKALLVGDVYQIEPVWTLPKGIDITNLRRCGLLDKEEEYASFWLDAQMSASSGNLMRLAHRQATQTQYDDLEPGLYLTEHRRCYDNIIEYCNRLIYKGHLEAKRGLSPESQCLPAMGFFHHLSQSTRQGSSRINTSEADVIVQWISKHASSFRIGEENELSVAVITPFRQQALVIKSALKKTAFKHIKVGTVNTFQGAESDIVLFSSVYGVNDGTGNKFYDRTPNMLNVAVSRAKNTFIVFGDDSVFGQGGHSSPSFLLKKTLTQNKY